MPDDIEVKVLEVQDFRDLTAEEMVKLPSCKLTDNGKMVGFFAHALEGSGFEAWCYQIAQAAVLVKAKNEKLEADRLAIAQKEKDDAEAEAEALRGKPVESEESVPA